MAADRLLRLLALLGSDTRDDGAPGSPRRLCTVAAEITGASGAGIMLLDASGPRGSLGTTDGLAELMEDLQYTLGEGPSVDAHRHGLTVTEPDLADPQVARWAAFSPQALEAGARAVFAFPVRLGAARLGALDLHRDRPGAMTGDQHADGLVMADVVARAVVAMQAEGAPDGVALALEAGADFHLVVHQAAGMVSSQLDVSVTDALIRIRAHAFATGQPINDVAAAVVERRLRFTERPAGT